MHILMVIEQMYLGGLETHVMTLCRQLIARKHTVYIYLAHSVGPWRTMLAKAGATLVHSPVEAESLDLIHLHVWGETALQALFWSEQLRIPLVATYHGQYKFHLEELRGKAKFICVSRTVRDFLGIDAAIIENGIDLEQFLPSPLPYNRTIAWLGRLDGKRWVTLDAIFRACEETQIKCKVAGVFLRPEALGIIKKYSQAEWCGAIFDVSSFLKEIDAVITTSRGVQETMASGRIAIVGNNMWYGGVVTPETVTELRRNSFMAWHSGPFIPSKLAADLNQLYQDPAVMAELGRWGAEYARREFPAAKMSAATEEVYRQAVTDQKAEVMPEHV